MSGYKILSHGSLSVVYDFTRIYAETLETRRLKLDLTIIFCIIRGFDWIIHCETSRTRGHNYNVSIQRALQYTLSPEFFCLRDINADEMTSIL